MNRHLTIIGAGLSGLAAAYFWEGEAVVYEATGRVGGAALSLTRNGFTFDRGPHVSFTRDETVRELFARSVDGNFHTKQVACCNYRQATRFGHPALYHLDQLPPHEALEILCSLVNTAWVRHSDVPVENYAQWCRLAQGKFFAERFTRHYTRKFWCSEPEGLETSWIGKRVDRADPQKVFEGILGLRNDAGYYYQEFRYPESGGFSSFTSFYRLALKPIEIAFNHRLVALDTKNRWILFDSGRKEHYDLILFTIPLPELVKAVRNVPTGIAEATGRLRCTSLKFINVCYGLPSPLREHWAYFYDEDMPSSRLSFFSNMSESNAPVGCSALQFEVPYTKDRPHPSSNIADLVLSRYARMEPSFRISEISDCFEDGIDYGYVVFDHNRSAALGEIKSWLGDQGIRVGGRYGEWDYLWSDQCILKAKEIVEAVGQDIASGLPK